MDVTVALALIATSAESENDHRIRLTSLRKCRKRLEFSSLSLILALKSRNSGRVEGFHYRGVDNQCVFGAIRRVTWVTIQVICGYRALIVAALSEGSVGGPEETHRGCIAH